MVRFDGGSINMQTREGTRVVSRELIHYVEEIVGFIHGQHLIKHSVESTTKGVKNGKLTNLLLIILLGNLAIHPNSILFEG